MQELKVWHVLLTLGFVKGTNDYVDLPDLVVPIFVRERINVCVENCFFIKQPSTIPVPMPVVSVNRSIKLGVLSKVKNCNDSVKQAKKTNPEKTGKEYEGNKKSVAWTDSLAYNWRIDTTPKIKNNMKWL